MAIKPVVSAAEIQTQTPEELEKATKEQAAAKQKEEKRLHDQTPYDPTVHGAGTAPVAEPQSVRELFYWVKGEFEKLRGNKVPQQPIQPSTTTIGEYSPTATYRVGNRTTFQGKLYQAHTATVGHPPSDDGYWTQVSVAPVVPIAAPVPAGTPAVLGDYSNLASYQVGNRVNYEGKVYVAVKATSPGILPTDGDYWQLTPLIQ